MSEDLIQQMKLIINSYNYPIITPPPSPEPPVVLKTIHTEWKIISQKKLESEILSDLIHEENINKLNKNKLSADAPEWTPVSPLPPVLSSIQLTVYNIFRFNNFPINLNIYYLMNMLNIDYKLIVEFIKYLSVNNIYILELNAKDIKLNYFNILN